MFNWLNKLVHSDPPEKKIVAQAESASQASTAAATSASANAVSADGEVSSPVSRMILLDRSAQILGYEFVSRSGSLGGRASEPKNAQANDQGLVRAVLGMGAERIGQFRQIWLTIGEAALAAGVLEGLPAQATVALITPGGKGAAMPEALEQARLLAGRGFRFGLSGFADRESHLEWLPLVDVVALDIAAYTPEELVATLELLHQKKAGLKVLARRIDSYEGYEYCMSKGFDVFSGKFLTHRESWPPQPPLNPDRVRLCNLLNDLRGGAELTDIAAGLKLSPELSYRFLRYINSAGMGVSSHIGSLEQGCVFLGREKLYRWFTLLLFSGTQGAPTDTALLEQALVRGRMMELMGSLLPRKDCEEMFVTGIFSVIDVLLRMPLDVAIRPLQLPGAVAQALLSASGPYADYLLLTKVCEEGEGSPTDTLTGKPIPSVAALAARVGLTVAQANRHHLDAMAWAQQLQTAPATPQG